MLTGINHLVILVNDLAEATAAYEAIGFTVTPGGEHPTLGTRNALVPFADDSYLELLAFKLERSDDLWWARLSAGHGGLVDFALVSDDLDRDAAVQPPLKPFNIVDGGRQTPDGRKISWRLGLPEGWRVNSLVPASSVPVPFLIQDVTPRALRVPQGAARRHANGVVGIDRVYVAVDDLAAAGTAYSALFGVSVPVAGRDDLFGVPGLRFACGTAQIILLDLNSIAGRLPDNLRRRGPGIIAVSAKSERPATGRWLDTSLAQGAVIYIH